MHRPKYRQVQSEVTQRKDLLMAFKKVANLSQIPFRIECFDIHLGGTLPVSAMVVFEQGNPTNMPTDAFSSKKQKVGMTMVV